MRLSAAGAREDPARRRTTAAVCVLALAGLAAPGVAAAQETSEPAPSDSPPAIHVPEPVPGEPVCEIADPRLVEISGMEAVGDQYIVVNDSQDFGFEDRLPIFFLNQDCEVVDQQPFVIGRPLDPEGMEYDPQSQTLWIGDTGDNAAGGTGAGDTRPSVALWRVDLGGGDRTPVIHRFHYPDNQPRDAEALVLDGDGTPMIVTKEFGTAGLYVPTEVVPSNSPDQVVPLEQVGEFSPPDTGTDNPFRGPGRQVITGGAVSPDGTRVVLRTYADAFEFDVVDGDVAGAITNGEPRVTPLPGEPQGEAITYTPDGSQFLTVSEVTEQAPGPAVILSYTPAVPPEPTTPPAEAGAPPAEGSGFSLFNNVQDIINLIVAVGVIGLILVGVGVFGIVRARRRRAANDDPEGPAPVTGRANLYGAGVAGGAAAASGSPAAPGAPVADPAAQEPGWEPGVGQPSGVYTSRTVPPGGEYAGGEHGAAQYGGGAAYPENPYAGGEYAGSEYAGNQYPGDQYQDDRYQDNQYRGAEYGGTGFPAGEHAGSGYAGHEHAGQEYAASQYAGHEYAGHEYAGQEYAGQEYAGQEYAGHEYAGHEYGAQGYGGGYAEAGYGDPHGGQYGGGYEQSGHAAPYGDAGGYPAQGYPAQGYPQQYPDQGHHPAGQPPPGQPPAGGYPAAEPEYGGEGAGTYQGGGQPDYYSEDPDYPYEFRGQGRW